MGLLRALTNNGKVGRDDQLQELLHLFEAALKDQRSNAAMLVGVRGLIPFLSKPHLT